VFQKHNTNTKPYLGLDPTHTKPPI